MAWWKRKIFKPSNVKAVLGTSDSLGALLIFGADGSGATPASALDLFKKSTAVSIPINMIAEAFASIEPVLKIGDKLIHKHDILDFLSMPSPYFTGNLFRETIAKDYLITGETESVALGNVNRPPLELQPISPRNVLVNRAAGGFAGSFVVGGEALTGTYLLARERNKVRYFDGKLRELKQIRNYSTEHNSMLRGQSLLLAASAEARQHIKGNNHNISMLDNGGRISLVFHFEEDLNPVDFAEVKRRVRAQYGGTSKAGEIGVTSGGKMDIKEMGINNKDMDYVKLQETAKNACALQYKVPLALIFMKASSFNNYKEAKLALYDDAVLPVADRLFAGLSQLMLPRYGLDPMKAKLTYDPDQITALKVRRNEELKLRKELNLESVDEMRVAIGRESVDGGSEILVPASMVPISQISIDDSGLAGTVPTVLRDEDEDEEVEE